MRVEACIVTRRMCICAIVENKHQRTLKCNILVHCSAVCRLALAVSPMQCKVQCVLKCDVYNVHKESNKESSIKEFAFNTVVCNVHKNLAHCCVLIFLLWQTADSKTNM